jgi:hypothetical protein
VPFLDCVVADAPRNDGIVIASEAKQFSLQCGFWMASSLTLLAMTAPDAPRDNAARHNDGP